MNLFRKTHSWTDFLMVAAASSLRSLHCKWEFFWGEITRTSFSFDRCPNSRDLAKRFVVNLFRFVYSINTTCYFVSKSFMTYIFSFDANLCWALISWILSVADENGKRLRTLSIGQGFQKTFSLRSFTQLRYLIHKCIFLKCFIQKDVF